VDGVTAAIGEPGAGRRAHAKGDVRTKGHFRPLEPPGAGGRDVYAGRSGARCAERLRTRRLAAWGSSRGRGTVHAQSAPSRACAPAPTPPFPPAPPAQDDAEARPLPGSGVAFTKNGALQGVAYADISEGTYYPAAALYTRHRQADGATVTFNFGPNFQFPPPRVEGWPEARPVSDLAGPPPAVAGSGDAAPEGADAAAEANGGAPAAAIAAVP
jgi:hypothetical protein